MVHLFYNGPLSQWAVSYFTVDEVMYSCAEQYMMVQKALFFGDSDTAWAIMNSNRPSIMKELGRSVKNFDKNRWEMVAKRFVYKANVEKFKEKLYRKYLIGTGDTIIAEASPLDLIWGIGLSENDPKALDPTQWKGTNWLGEILMQIRQEIKEGAI